MPDVMHDLPPTERLHALDALRASALFLGVFLHATMAYFPAGQMWVLLDSPSHVLSGGFYVVHVFRMPLFFVIAGFFARMLLERRGVKTFVRNRAARIAAPFLVFYVPVTALLVATFIWAIRVSGSAPVVPANAPAMSLATFPLTHLWFLYVLILFYVAALLLRALVGAVDPGGKLSVAADVAMRFLAGSPVASLLLAVPLAAAFLLSPEWWSWFGIQPPAFGFIPNPGAAAGYGTAFAFGWLLHRQPDLLARLGRWWVVNIVVAVLLTAYCIVEAGTVPDLTPTPKSRMIAVYAVCYAIAVWAWMLGLVGAAILYLNSDRPAVRYLADSSYWIYLVHPPVLAVFHIALFGLPLPALVKFALALAATMIVMLASYEYLVRHSFMGRWLNGRRYPRRTSGGEAKGPVAVE
jgi:glucan biosynthesis protein C